MFLADCSSCLHWERMWRDVRHRFSFLRYLTVIVFFGLGLMAKPMLVTLPFVLLLLDYWPLGRLATGATDYQNAGWSGYATTSSEPTARQDADKWHSHSEGVSELLCVLCWKRFRYSA